MVLRSVHRFMQREFLIGIALVLAALVALSSAVGEFRTGISLIRDGISTTGVVVDVIYRKRGYSGGTWPGKRVVATSLTVEFRTEDGKLHRFSQARTGPVLWAGDPGQKVAIRYRPSDPSVFEVRAVTRTDRAFILFVFGLLGVVGGGALMFFSSGGRAQGIITLERDYYG